MHAFKPFVERLGLKSLPVPTHGSSASSTAHSPGIRVVCISDTHSLHLKMPEVPHADMIIHAGDMTSTGTLSEIRSFMEWFDNLPHRHKIFIAGNHDVSIDSEYYLRKGMNRFHRALRAQGMDPLAYSNECREVFSSAKHSVYLEDSSAYLSFKPRHTDSEPTCDEFSPCELVHSAAEAIASSSYNDVCQVYGSPWQPEFCDWAFNMNRGTECMEKWAKIPDYTDILITHGPPQGYGDRTATGLRCGCADLLQRIREMPRQPRVHIFGHIHEDYGHWFDGKTLFINASTCTRYYKPQNPPIIFHLPFDKTLPAMIVE